MSLPEIVLPDIKPTLEWVRGRAREKIGGTYVHAAMQGELAIAFTRWDELEPHGRVAMEWTFRVAPPGEVVRPLVPDFAFLSYAALGEDAPADDVAMPLMAPTVVVEIILPEESRDDLDGKIATYLTAGSSAVIEIDVEEETVTIYEHAGVRVLRAGDTLLHDALPDFSLDVGELFVRVKR